MKKYNPLHCHSMYSLLDGLSKPSQIRDRCLEIGATACALTDHGNISGAVKFHNVLKTAGIKPILGCEIYLCDQNPSIQSKENKNLSHFIVLAKNLKGWQQLIQLVSASNQDNFFYHKPRLDLKNLASFCDGNIIGFCGHLGSLLADKLVVNNHLKMNNEK
jgi:DNA polymerase-3 subunit alpha